MMRIKRGGATPLPEEIFMDYMDQPEKQTDILDEMSVDEVVIYIKGYLQSCYWFKEMLIESKHKFISAALSEPERSQKRLMSYVELLDEFERRSEEKIKNLLNLLEDAVDL